MEFTNTMSALSSNKQDVNSPSLLDNLKKFRFQKKQVKKTNMCKINFIFNNNSQPLYFRPVNYHGQLLGSFTFHKLAVLYEYIN